MTEALDKFQPLKRQIATLLLLFLFATAGGLMGMYQFQPNPYIHKVLSLQGNITQGIAIFQMNCSGCHGFEANGKVGPSLKAVSNRKSRQALIEQVIGGKTPPMPQFQPSPQEMADLLSFLEKL